MKTFVQAISIIFVLIGLSASQHLLASETNAVLQQKIFLPVELEDLLKNADEFILFSIEPMPDYEHKSTNTFQGHAILGQLKVQSPSTRAKLIAALNGGIREEHKSVPPGVEVAPPDCFNPRHGIRAKKNDETIEFLICFECSQIQVSSNKGKSWFFMTTKKPAGVFNIVLRKARVPLPKD